MPDISEVTLSAAAQKYCAQFGVGEDDLRAARANAWSLYERDGWLACRGKLPAADREAIMYCRSSSRAQVESFRLVS